MSTSDNNNYLSIGPYSKQYHQPGKDYQRLMSRATFIEQKAGQIMNLARLVSEGLHHTATTIRQMAAHNSNDSTSVVADCAKIVEAQLQMTLQILKLNVKPLYPMQYAYTAPTPMQGYQQSNFLGYGAPTTSCEHVFKNMIPLMRPAIFKVTTTSATLMYLDPNEVNEIHPEVGAFPCYAADNLRFQRNNAVDASGYSEQGKFFALLINGSYVNNILLVTRLEVFGPFETKEAAVQHAMKYLPLDIGHQKLPSYVITTDPSAQKPMFEVVDNFK